MNIKKILPIIFLFIVVLSISSVAATSTFYDLQAEIDDTSANGTLYLENDYSTDEFLMGNNIKGMVTYEYGEVSEGNHVVDVVLGDNEYLASEDSEEFSRYNYKILVDDLTSHSSSIKLEATLLKDDKPVAKANLAFNINGMEYIRTTDNNGVAYITIKLNPGVYKLVVSVDSQDPIASAKATVTILPSIVTADGEMFYQDGSGIVAKFTDSEGNALANTVVTFNINGVFYNRTTDANGKAFLKLNLLPKEYICTAYNPVTGEQRGINVNIKPLIVANDLVKTYGEAAAFTATFYNKDGSLAVGKEACFNINGVFYYRTVDANGQAKLNINLLPGEYIITTILGTLDNVVAFAGNTVTVKAA